MRNTGWRSTDRKTADGADPERRRALVRWEAAMQAAPQGSRERTEAWTYVQELRRLLNGRK